MVLVISDVVISQVIIKLNSVKTDIDAVMANILLLPKNLYVHL